MGPPNGDILKFPGFLCRFNHHLGFISFETKPIKDLSALFLGVRVTFFLDKRSSEESRIYSCLLKLRTKGSKKVLLLLRLAILCCYEKVVLSLPQLHPNPCLDISHISLIQLLPACIRFTLRWCLVVGKWITQTHAILTESLEAAQPGRVGHICKGHPGPVMLHSGLCSWAT